MMKAFEDCLSETKEGSPFDFSADFLSLFESTPPQEEPPQPNDEKF